MKVIAVNGSPRKKWNTATMLTRALQGSADRGALTELIHLYDLDYRGLSLIHIWLCRRALNPEYEFDPAASSSLTVPSVV